MLTIQLSAQNQPPTLGSEGQDNRGAASGSYTFRRELGDINADMPGQPLIGNEGHVIHHEVSTPTMERT